MLIFTYIISIGEKIRRQTNLFNVSIVKISVRGMILVVKEVLVFYVNNVNFLINSFTVNKIINVRNANKWV